MNEKIYQYIMYLILLAVIFLTFMSVNAKISENRLFKERSLARDLAFTYDLALSAPEELNLTVEINEDYTISIDKTCKLEVKKGIENPTIYNCGLDQSQKLYANKNKLTT